MRQCVDYQFLPLSEGNMMICSPEAGSILPEPKVSDNMSHGMGFPTMWYVRPAKLQISLRIRADWSEPLLVAWIFYDC